MSLKHLLKRGGLLAAANWPAVAILFAAQTTFQVLLAVPLVGAAVMVAVFLGADLNNLLQGSTRDIFGTISDALVAEPMALAAFVTAFVIVMIAGSVLMFLVKGGTVDVMLAADAAVGPIERDPLTFAAFRGASAFSLPLFVHGCARLFRRYLTLGLWLMGTYTVSGLAYVAFVVYGYRLAGDRGLFVGWTLVTALSAIALVVWITMVNVLYLFLQIATAAEDVGAGPAVRHVARFVRAEYRELGGVFLVVFAMVVAATVASAIAWSGVGLIAFVPLVGLAVFPLQIAALLMRGLVFEYIGLTAMGAYATLYRRHVERTFAVTAEPPARGTPRPAAWDSAPAGHS